MRRFSLSCLHNQILTTKIPPIFLESSQRVKEGNTIISGHRRQKQRIFGIAAIGDRRLFSIKTSPPPPKMINFAKGHPNPNLLPIQEIRDIFTRIASSSNQDSSLAESLNYPTRDAGTSRLLEELKSFINRQTQNDDLGDTANTTQQSLFPASPTNIFMTHGVSHGLDMLCAACTKPGDVVLVEQPTYFLAAGIFRSHRLSVHNLPMLQDNGQIDMDRLEADMDSGAVSPPSMIYIIPTHQNPTGSVMPIKTRWRLARLARRHKILVVADEVYHWLDWRDDEESHNLPRPARMAVIDSLLLGREDETYGDLSSSQGCCVTVSSFTKIFAPGIRCGWIEGPSHIVESLENVGYIQSQGGCTPLIGEIMYTALSTGMNDRVLANLNQALRKRSRALCEILTSTDGIRLHTVPLGGYFVWVSFDLVDDTNHFLDFCTKQGVRFLPGEKCDVRSDDAAGTTRGAVSSRKFARFCFADLDFEDIERGANIMVECYKQYINPTSVADYD